MAVFSFFILHHRSVYYGARKLRQSLCSSNGQTEKTPARRDGGYNAFAVLFRLCASFASSSHHVLFRCRCITSGTRAIIVSMNI